MKKYLLALTLMLTFSVTAIEAAPRHRHHQQTAVSIDKDGIKVQPPTESIEAYSDTTSTVDSVAEDSASEPTNYQHVSYDPGDYDDPFSFWGNTIGWGVGGILLASLIILLCFLFLLAPLIVVILLIRYFIKRHNDRVSLAEKAMENGQQIPESMKPVDKQSDEYLWKRGVKNAAIGAGLMIMFWFWDADALAGVGALILCYGLGQMFLGHHSRKRGDRNEF